MDGDVAEPDLVALIRRFADRRKPLLRSTAIYHDLQIAGDDAYELLVNVRKRFGISFEKMDFNAYFPNETEALWCYWKAKIGFPDAERHRLTVGHLLAVIERGAWFDPENSN